MLLSENLNLRLSPADREVLAALAQKLNRSQADTIRFSVRELARVLVVSDSMGQLDATPSPSNEKLAA